MKSLINFYQNQNARIDKVKLIINLTENLLDILF